MGTNNETLGCRTYIVKGETGEQSQIVTSRWFQNANVRGGDDFNRLHEVREIALSSLESDFIAQANIAQRAEKSIPVARQGDITPFAGQSRFRKVTNSPPQAGGRVALNNHDVQPQTGHLNLADHITFRQNGGLVEEARWLEMLHFKGLIRVRINEDEACVTQSEEAGDEEEVARAAEDAGSR